MINLANYREKAMRRVQAPRIHTHRFEGLLLKIRESKSVLSGADRMTAHGEYLTSSIEQPRLFGRLPCASRARATPLSPSRPSVHPTCRAQQRAGSFLYSDRRAAFRPGALRWLARLHASL